MCMNKLLNNFRQFFIFMLTSVFTVETSETKKTTTKKLKNDIKFANCQSLKESFPPLFCSVVLISVGCNSEHVEADEGKQKVDLSYRKWRGHNARN